MVTLGRALIALRGHRRLGLPSLLGDWPTGGGSRWLLGDLVTAPGAVSVAVSVVLFIHERHFRRVLIGPVPDPLPLSSIVYL